MSTNLVASALPATPALIGLIDHAVSPSMTAAPNSTFKDATPGICFSSVIGDTYSMYDNGRLIGTMVATTDTTAWTVPSTLVNGDHKITIYATDPSGKSSAGLNLDLTIGAGPAVPLFLGLIDHSISDYANVLPEAVLHDANPGLVLQGNIGDTFTVYDGNHVIASVVLTTTNISLPTLANGTHHLSIIETSKAGISAPLFVDLVVAAPAAPSLLGMIDHTVDNNFNFNVGELSNDPHPTVVLSAKIGDTLTVFDNGVQIGTIVATSEQMAWTMPTLADGRHSLSITETNSAGTSAALNLKFTVFADGALVPADTTPDAPLPTPDTNSHTVVGLHDAFVATGDHQTADLSVDPAAYFKQSTAHIEGGADGVHTLHLTGSNEVLDLTSLSGKTAAAKISGMEVIDLGGHGNALNLSIVDVLNLGQTDLFQYDGNKQMMVNGSAGDTVDLLHATVARVADTGWEQQGTAAVGGVVYNVYEHAGAQTELLIQQGVNIVVH